MGFIRESVIARHWRMIAGLVTTLMAAIILLDITGYRYSSRTIMESVASSAALLIVMPPVYRRVIEAIQAVSRRVRPVVSELTGKEDAPPSEIATRAQRSIRFLFWVGGTILLVERPVRPGDTVAIGDMSGQVQRINIRATTIMNFGRQEVIVPNRSLITTNVTNWTRSDTVNGLVISIGVAYGSHVDAVRTILMRTATGQPEVLTDPPPSVIFRADGESSLDFNLRVFLPGRNELMTLRNRLNTLINKECVAAGIEIPFPQRDLHIRSSDVPPGSIAAKESGK